MSICKKAILVVAFGTSYQGDRRSTIDVIVGKASQRFPQYEVRQAFTSEMIIRKLRERDNEQADNPQQALERLRQDGFDTVIVQPLHIIPGHEWKKVVRAVRNSRRNFQQVALGRPLLFFGQGEEIPNDYGIAAEALRQQLPLFHEGNGVLLMAHGSSDPANACYPCFERVLHEIGLTNVFLASVEGHPTLEDVKIKLHTNKLQELTLVPFMLAAGSHALNDMAGDHLDSWKRQLRREGFNVIKYLRGLGENECFQEIYLQHIQDAIAGTYHSVLTWGWIKYVGENQLYQVENKQRSL